MTPGDRCWKRRPRCGALDREPASILACGFLGDAAQPDLTALI
jgi:hypothetical protein